MAIENVETKLQEAQTFLDKMRDQEQTAFGHKEPFNYCLSAFLSAGMSVRDAFHVQQDRKRDGLIKRWKEDWESQLTPEQTCVYEFMRKNRNFEVHTSGARLIVKPKEIKVGSGGSYSDKSGTLWVMGSPSPLIGPDTGATISKRQYFFNICGIERPVTEVCAEYVTLLSQMVAQYKIDASH